MRPDLPMPREGSVSHIVANADTGVSTGPRAKQDCAAKRPNSSTDEEYQLERHVMLGTQAIPHSL
jgi:hypothetical protein